MTTVKNVSPTRTERIFFKSMVKDKVCGRIHTSQAEACRWLSDMRRGGRDVQPTWQSGLKGYEEEWRTCLRTPVVCDTICEKTSAM